MNDDSRVVEVELSRIVPNRFQPRKVFNEDINELAESIKNHGVLQPITIRPLGGKYEIVMGERRYRACEKLGLLKIPAIIVDINDRECMEVALIENLQRQDLSPIEEALSYKRILESGYITQEELARKIGKNQSTIANKLRLLSLGKEIQEALLKNAISERHARALLKLDKKEDQVRLLNRIVNERLTVKTTEEVIEEMKKNPSQEIEIIDFEEDTFVEKPTPDIEPVEDDYNSYTTKSSDEKNLFESPKGTSTSSKTLFPSSTIIDDFKVKTNTIGSSNHSYEVDVDGLKEAEENTIIDEIIPDRLEIVEEEEMEEKEEEPVPNIAVKSFDAIQELLDNFQNQVQSLGYEVEVEKVDFETMYQLIFKIKK